uniref:restriction endonuclease subunit S n=1 Tax=Veillonella parvula TaxID=29466 RepID=UPI003AB143A5
MSFMMLAELCDKGSSSLAQKDLLFDSGIYPVYGAAGEITKVDFFHQSKPYLGLIKDGAGVGRVMKLPANSSVIGTIQYLFPRENVDLKYLYYLIKYLDLGKSNTGATIPHIYFKDYKKRKVKVRDYSEQKHIGQILELIDSHLSTYKNILDQY